MRHAILVIYRELDDILDTLSCGKPVEETAEMLLLSRDILKYRMIASRACWIWLEIEATKVYIKQHRVKSQALEPHLKLRESELLLALWHK